MKIKKNHRMGTCPACRFLVRVNKEGKCYQHIGKRTYMEPYIRKCLGTGQKAEDIMDGDPDDLLKEAGL